MWSKRVETCFISRDDFLGFVSLDHIKGEDIAENNFNLGEFWS